MLKELYLLWLRLAARRSCTTSTERTHYRRRCRR